jgi:pimeloyl-ACP methyl ester carboxylesterase
VYGAKDTETPPEIGARLHALIPDSSLFVLDGFDHYSILSDGKHKVIQKLNQMIQEKAA